jgi:hypothetical protein
METDDNGIFYLVLKHQPSDSAELPVNVQVSAQGYKHLSWLAIAPVKNMTVPMSPIEPSARPNQKSASLAPRQ